VAGEELDAVGAEHEGCQDDTAQREAHGIVGSYLRQNGREHIAEHVDQKMYDRKDRQLDPL
jgi:hypothetical protein